MRKLTLLLALKLWRSVCFLSVLSSKQKTRQNQECRNLHSKSSPSNDSKFPQVLIIFPNYVYICRNKRAQEAVDSGVFTSFHPLIIARFGIFKNMSASWYTTKDVGLYLPGAPGWTKGKAGVGNTDCVKRVSRKTVDKRQMEGSHDLTSHFSLYHASLLDSYKSKEILLMTSPGC